MINPKKLKKFKSILILVFISSCFLVTFIYMFLKDVPVISSLLNDYFTSGNSIFIPSLPYTNIFGFLPEGYQIQFSLGNLIDIIIIINIYCWIDTGFYHYFKRIFLNGESKIFNEIDSYCLGFKGKLELYQDPDIVFGFRDELKYYLDDKRIRVIERTRLKNERIDYFYGHLSRKTYSSKTTINKIFHRKSKFKLNRQYKTLYFCLHHSIFDIFWTFHSKNPYPHPEINTTDSNNYIQWEEKL